MMVVALVMVVSGIAIPVSRNMIARSKAKAATMEMLTWFEMARNRATAERRNFEVTINSTQRTITLERVEASGSKTPILVRQLPENVTFVQYSGVGDTPDQFGAGSAIDFDGPTPYMFTSEGMFVDGNGDPSNGTLFMGKPGLPDTGAAMTVFGTTGLLRAWKLAGKQVAQMSTDTRPSQGVRQSEAGFSLMEVLIAMLVLTVGVLSLLGVIALGVQTVAASSPMLIAREKAREAIESVHAARDTGELAWSRIYNVADGGVFLAGMRDLRLPGVDGLVNTADDAIQPIEFLRHPGADGVLNNSDDIITRLDSASFQREIVITTLNQDGTTTLNPNLRRIIVNVRYRVLGGWRDLHADHLHLELFMIMRAPTRHRAGDRGYSLIELLIAMGLTTVVMGVTMAGLSDAMRANDMVVNVTTMNNGLRLAMDLDGARHAPDRIRPGKGARDSDPVRRNADQSAGAARPPELHQAGDRGRHSGGDSGRPASVRPSTGSPPTSSRSSPPTTTSRTCRCPRSPPPGSK